MKLIVFDKWIVLYITNMIVYTLAYYQEKTDRHF
jgi:hypothetical protein